MLGELLGDWRNINYVKARDLTDGITTVKMLKKYETGKKRPEKLRADALWQRAGKSMDKFDIYKEDVADILIELLFEKGLVNKETYMNVYKHYNLHISQAA